MILALGAIVVLLVVFVIGMYNGLVRLKVQCDNAWSDIDVQLKRRYDLIPNLVETVKGAATHEEKVIGEVTEARAAMMGAKTPQERIQANQQLDGALGRLLVVVENYPNIKANENFLHLQDELAGTENRINVERRKYNETVQKYNTDIALFPQNIAAGIWGFHREDAYFKADVAAKEAPKVKF
jgi:LemA protein